jgi:hypothetical protein
MGSDLRLALGGPGLETAHGAHTPHPEQHAHDGEDDVGVVRVSRRQHHLTGFDNRQKERRQKQPGERGHAGIRHRLRAEPQLKEETDRNAERDLRQRVA